MLVKSLCLEPSVIIHLAEPNDLPAIFALVDTYCEEIKVDKTKAKNSLREIVYLKSALLVEHKGQFIGGIAGYIIPGLFNDDMYFSTMFFYVLKQYRFLTKRIIKEIELVLLPTKVTKIVYGVAVNDSYKKQKRFMRMMGYKELECHMIKDI